MILDFDINLEEYIEKIETIIVEKALSKVELPNEGMVVNRNLCEVAAISALYFCLTHFSMFDELQQKDIDNIYKQVILL